MRIDSNFHFRFLQVGYMNGRPRVNGQVRDLPLQAGEDKLPLLYYTVW